MKHTPFSVEQVLARIAKGREAGLAIKHLQMCGRTMEVHKISIPRSRYIGGEFRKWLRVTADKEALGFLWIKKIKLIQTNQ